MDSKRGHFRAKIARDARGSVARRDGKYVTGGVSVGGTTIAAKMGVKRGLDGRSVGRRKLCRARNRSTDTLFPVTVPGAGRKAICHGKSVLIEIFGTVTPNAEGTRGLDAPF